MFEEIRKELKGKSDQAIYRYLKSIDLSSVIQYLKENSTYNDISEKRQFKLIQDFLKGKNNVCPVCGKIIEHERKNCSMKCRDLNPETQKKAKETNIKRYGVENAFQNKDIQEKYKDTYFKKHGVKNPSENPDVVQKRKKTLKEHLGVESPFQSAEVREKIKNTNLEKYGVENVSQNKEVREKAKATNLKRYSTECPLQNKDVQEKARETNIKKFGVENPFQNKEVQEKYKATCLRKFGVENVFQNKDIKEKIKNTNIEKYGVENPMQNKDVQERFKNTNIEKYGTEYPTQNKDVQEKYKEANIRKYGVEYSAQSKIKNFNLYNDKNYIKENLFLDNRTPNSKAIQEFFGISQSTCSRHLRELFKDEIHYNSGTSYSERELQEYVKALSQNVICNDRTIINPKELDIVIPDVGLCIEYDGSYWHNAEIKGPNYHLNKTKMCSEKGYQLFHIFEFDDIEIWKSMISNKLNLNTTIYARKCVIQELKYSQVKDFLDENHLQGTCTSKINLGLFYNDELVEVMTFGKPRFNRNYDYELLRLCTKKFYSVIGGASKLFKYFISNYKGSIISYANRRFSNGNIYRQLGFNELKASNPNYFYSKGDIVLTRYQCQKHKLKGLFDKGILDTYSPELTESEIMNRNGYFRLYDCGNLVFEYKNSINI